MNGDKKVVVSTKYLSDHGLLEKALGVLKPAYKYPSIEISELALISLTEEQAREIGCLIHENPFKYPDSFKNN